MKERIDSSLCERISSAEAAAGSITSGMTVAMGGYTSSGYPKAVATELVKLRADEKDFKINILGGSSIGPIEDLLANAHMIDRVMPMIDSKTMSQSINQFKIHYVEQQMSKMPRLLRSGAFGKVDVAIIEAIACTKEGHIIPTSSVGMTPKLLDMAESVIIEINLAQPENLVGFHDIYLPGFPPNREPIPLYYVNQRIGDPFLRVDPEKIKYIVESNQPDETTNTSDGSETTQKITDNLLNFLELEVKNQWEGYLPPIQTGIGNLASNIVHAFSDSNFRDISFFCGGLLEANLELMLTGKVKAASAGSIQMTPRVMDIIRSHADELKKILVIRNAEITNNAETIGRMGIISLSSAIEADIYGNVNSSHIAGTKVVNGIGGGANFAQNASLSVLLIPSETKGGAISTIVPMVSHLDIVEHDIDVMITEQGVADLRGKDEVERAQCIIRNCASPFYKAMLDNYLKRAIEQVGGHHPQLLEEGFSWHIRLSKTGTMQEK
ncbi:MAG: acetyl-CoA hydrolase/transferase C-terminal domain-containing protein [Christensenellales bacterium]